MEHFANLNHPCTSMPVSVRGLPTKDRKKAGSIQPKVAYKATRSTLALNAIELTDLKADQATDTFKCLMRLCKTLERDEIVIECLESLPNSSEDQSVKASFNSLQKEVNLASRKMNLCPPRVALEKRGQHFDLRIYPTFH
ncbi:MAG: hypothetical protein KUG69_13850 [Marinosulfonomonas sp.]|nr:hypothetical protein [Marinosulfonomonas sp.]